MGGSGKRWWISFGWVGVGVEVYGARGISIGKLRCCNEALLAKWI